ncbi:MAG: hypothetical protein LBC20_11725, partial [Planctomycetaceae bacterium]|nr:hypothetical protein [Planctomycetaceae bacterium]
SYEPSPETLTDEERQHANGYFTGAILDCFRNRDKITLFGLSDHITEFTKDKSKNKQHPVINFPQQIGSFILYRKPVTPNVAVPNPAVPTANVSRAGVDPVIIGGVPAYYANTQLTGFVPLNATAGLPKPPGVPRNYMPGLVRVTSDGQNHMVWFDPQRADAKAIEGIADKWKQPKGTDNQGIYEDPSSAFRKRQPDKQNYFDEVNGRESVRQPSSRLGSPTPPPARKPTAPAGTPNGLNSDNSSWLFSLPLPKPTPPSYGGSTPGRELGAY